MENLVREKMDVCILHLDRLIALKNENIAVREMRKHAAWYLKGIRGNAKVRNAINECTTREEIVTLLNRLVGEVEERGGIICTKLMFDIYSFIQYNTLIKIAFILAVYLILQNRL